MTSTSNRMITAAIAGIVCVSLTTASSTALAAKKNNDERCYGVVKAGMNDCGNSAHACAGLSKKDGDPNEWILVPQGLCKKIVGGSLVPGGKIKNDKMKKESNME